MRLLLLIENLCSGGAQRQICMLAKLLKERGYDVVLAVYHENDFFEPEMQEAGVHVEKVLGGGKYTKLFFVRSFVRNWKPDAVIAYLDTPNLIAEFSGLPYRKFAIIVSERAGKVGSISMKDRIRLQAHSFADAVVANGKTLKEFVVKNCPRLESKSHVIYNCVDFDKFDSVKSKPRDPEVFDIVTVGRYRPVKNPDNLVKAMQILAERQDRFVRLTWYGDNFFQDDAPTSLSDTYLKLKEQIEQCDLSASFVLKYKTKNVVKVYSEADAVCIASFFEGFSNVLGEAVACGKPVIASNVCDNPTLVRNNENGFLFDPQSPEDIANAFSKMANSSHEQLLDMSRQSRRIAIEILSPAKFVDSYLELISKVTEKYRQVKS